RVWSGPASWLEFTQCHDGFAAGRRDVLLLEHGALEERLLPADGGYGGKREENGGDRSVFHARHDIRAALPGSMFGAPSSIPQDRLALRAGCAHFTRTPRTPQRRRVL